MNEVFCVKMYCIMSDLFCQFLLALRLSARKPEIKNNLYSKYEILNHLYFDSNLFLEGTALGRFSHLFFFTVDQPWWPTFLLSLVSKMKVTCMPVICFIFYAFPLNTFFSSFFSRGISMHIPQGSKRTHQQLKKWS